MNRMDLDFLILTGVVMFAAYSIVDVIKSGFAALNKRFDELVQARSSN